MAAAASPYQVSRGKANTELALIQRAFRRAKPRVWIDHLTRGDGDIDYLYQRDVILLRRENLASVQGTLKEVFDVEGTIIPLVGPARRLQDHLILLSVARIRSDVPRILDAIDARLGSRIATPHHVLSVAGVDPVPNCPPSEPQPVAKTARPVPGVRRASPEFSRDGAGVRLYVADTGLVAKAQEDHLWLAGATGDPDEVTGGRIRPYCGHGTFVAGVARCMAPAVTVTVRRVFPYAGAALELDVAGELDKAVADGAQVINLSACGTTRRDFCLLGFEPLLDKLWPRNDGSGVVLVAAAGNSGNRREFWPAAFPGVIAVGALTANERQRARWSSFGDWVNVYIRGESLVNAFATGVYTYGEPPVRVPKRRFEGMARWSGTSFATALVAGLITAQMTRANQTAPQAVQKLLRMAKRQEIKGVGPVLYPRFSSTARSPSKRSPV